MTFERRMLHHVGGQRRIVDCQAEYDAAIAEGWRHRPILPVPLNVSSENAPAPTVIPVKKKSRR